MQHTSQSRTPAQLGIHRSRILVRADGKDPHLQVGDGWPLGTAGRDAGSHVRVRVLVEAQRAPVVHDQNMRVSIDVQ